LVVCVILHELPSSPEPGWRERPGIEAGGFPAYEALDELARGGCERDAEHCVSSRQDKILDPLYAPDDRHAVRCTGSQAAPDSNRSGLWWNAERALCRMQDRVKADGVDAEVEP
jgi:hypothetical protein